MSEHDWNQEMLAHAELVVEYGKEVNMPLDYSLKSVNIIDVLVGQYTPEKPKGLLGRLRKKEDEVIDPTLIEGLCIRFGAYLGEVIRREKSGNWEFNEEFECVALRVGDQVWFPLSKVQKRIVNGPEDDLHAFAVVATQ